MKAIVQDRYGSPDVLELRDVEKPVVGDDGVLVRVRAAALNAGDWHHMRGLPYAVRMGGGLRKPKQSRLGTDVAGHVTSAPDALAICTANVPTPPLAPLTRRDSPMIARVRVGAG
jgi:NADPH:quinone reductase-like Zn-dependent oxidoreductase